MGNLLVEKFKWIHSPKIKETSLVVDN